MLKAKNKIKKNILFLILTMIPFWSPAQNFEIEIWQKGRELKVKKIEFHSKNNLFNSKLKWMTQKEVFMLFQLTQAKFLKLYKSISQAYAVLWKLVMNLTLIEAFEYLLR